MATAIVQLFFLASAIAAAATFFAVSRLIDAPYGFGICARVLEAPSASHSEQGLDEGLRRHDTSLSRFLRAGRFCRGPGQGRFFSTLRRHRDISQAGEVFADRERDSHAIRK